MWFNYNMKNRKKLQMLLIGSALLTILSGCRPQSEDRILIPKVNSAEINEDSALLPLTYEMTKAFMEGKRSFILYFGSPLCHFCNELKPLLIDYVSKTKTEIYCLDATSLTYEQNFDYFKSTFSLRGTPTITLIKNGEIIHQEVGSQNLKTGVAVSNFFRNHIFTSLYTHRIDLSIPLPKNEKSVLFTYDFNNSEHQKVINTYFYPHFHEQNINVSITNMITEPKTITLEYLDTSNVITLDPQNEEALKVVQSEFLEYFQ